MYSILRWKCPRCHEGDLFISSNAYRVGELSAMPDRCGHCGQKFLLEPGFYYGAMYVSYALTVALSVAVFVAMVVLWEFRPLWYIGINAAIILLLFPWILRTSRAAWINFFVGYEKGAVKRD